MDRPSPSPETGGGMTDKSGSTHHYTLVEVARNIGTDETTIITYVRNEWITPADEQGPSFDEEDLARCHLIHELKELFGVNEEGLPIILRLLDQIHLLQREARNRSSGPRAA